MNIKYKVVKKSESRLMRFVSALFGLLRIMTKEKFMRNYTTTLSYPKFFPWRWVHTIFSPSGNPSARVRSHEKFHMVQNERDGVLYPLRYLFSKRWRARYEVEAYLGSQPGLGLDKLIEKLKSYRCRPKDVERFWFEFSGHEKKEK